MMRRYYCADINFLEEQIVCKQALSESMKSNTMLLDEAISRMGSEEYAGQDANALRDGLENMVRVTFEEQSRLIDDVVKALIFIKCCLAH